MNKMKGRKRKEEGNERGEKKNRKRNNITWTLINDIEGIEEGKRSKKEKKKIN